MRKKAKSSMVRFQADLPPADAAFVESLKAELGVHSNAKLLTEAAAIVKWMVAERHSGRRIASFEEDTPMRELVSAVIECSALGQSPPRVELQWTPMQLHRIHALLSGAASEPPLALVKAISGS
jgi:hypothetical protein